MRAARAIVLTDDDRQTLSKWAVGRSTAVRLAERARIVLRAADGMMNKDIAVQVGTDRRTVSRWRNRFAALGLAGIQQDAPRSGRPAPERDRVARQILKATIETQPANATHWTTRTLAKHLGVSHSMVHRVWQAHELKPHLAETPKLSSDPHLVAKLRAALGEVCPGLPVRLVVLFGSQADGRARPDSDVDIGVWFHGATEYSAVSAIIRAVEPIAGDREVDCVPLSWSAPTFTFNVAESGIPLYERTPISFLDYYLTAHNEYDEAAESRRAVRLHVHEWVKEHV